MLRGQVLYTLRAPAGGGATAFPLAGRTPSRGATETLTTATVKDNAVNHCRCS